MESSQAFELIEYFRLFVEPTSKGWWVASIDENATGFEGWHIGEDESLAEAVLDAVESLINTESGIHKGNQ